MTMNLLDRIVSKVGPKMVVPSSRGDIMPEDSLFQTSSTGVVVKPEVTDIEINHYPMEQTSTNSTNGYLSRDMGAPITSRSEKPDIEDIVTDAGFSYTLGRAVTLLFEVNCGAVESISGMEEAKRLIDKEIARATPRSTTYQ